MEAYVKLENVTKIYRMGEIEIRAADGIDFEIMKGEFVVIVGPSGAGKTTVLNVLGGMDTVTGGSIWVDGKDISKYSSTELTGYRRDDIGFVFQFYNLIPTLTTEENIMLPRLLDNRRPDPEKLSYILNMTGLADRRTHLPSELSGGQQQRVSIGRALINDPAFILADEPTGNLDSKSGREIIDLLQLANKKYHQTLLLITHDEKIAVMADRIITIGDGEIISDEELKASRSKGGRMV